MQKSLKFVHCADVHLDAPFSEQSGGYSETRRKDIRNAFLNIIKRTVEEKAELLLISGDLYEHGYSTRKTMEWLNMVLAGLSIPVVILPGNHDPYLLNSWYKAWEWPSNVHILSPENPDLFLEKECVQLFGVGFSSFKAEKPDLSIVLPPKKGAFNILMLHGTLDMDFTEQAYNPVTSRELANLQYDYYALGHFHTANSDYPLKNAINPGSPEPLSFGEPGAHGAFLVTLTELNGEKNLESKRFETAIRRYRDENLDITACKTLEEVKFKILGVLEGLDSGYDITRMTLKGRTDLQIDLDVISEFLSGDWLFLKLRDDTKNAFDLEALQKDISLKGIFVREIQGRMSRLDAELEMYPHNKELNKQKTCLELALNFGLEALSDGKITW